MIDLTLNRELPSIASDWAEDVIAFLTDKLTPRRKVKVSYNGHSRKVDRKILQYAFRFGERCRAAGKNKADWKSAWHSLLPYLTEKEKLTADPDTLKTYAGRLSEDNAIQNAVKDTCIDIYNDFTALKAYDYFERLKIRTCPYCNRHYTFTVRKTRDGFSTRPEYDHFHDKSSSPHLALAFYNLVPSCHECNHNKSTRTVNVHPYAAKFRSSFVITDTEGEEELGLGDILTLKSEREFHIRLRDKTPGTEPHPAPGEAENIRTFGLEALYDGHRDYVLDLIAKRNSYDAVTRAGILDSFQGVFRTPGEIFDVIWGYHLEESCWEQRPLSKLTRDILDQLGI